MSTHDGRIFVIGGHDGTSETNQTWEYDPEANTWITGRANIPVAMAGSATGVVEHFIYLVSHLNGGAGSNLHYRYDILLNTWTLMPPAPATLYQPVGATIGRQIAVVGGPNLRKLLQDRTPAAIFLTPSTTAGRPGRTPTFRTLPRGGHLSSATGSWW